MKSTINVSVCIQNLYEYNNGQLIYKWIELPASEEEINNALAEISTASSQEYMIADVSSEDGIFNSLIKYYNDIYEVNSFLEELELARVDSNIVKTVCHLLADKQEIVETLECGNYIILDDINDTEDLGEALVFNLDWLGLSREELDRVALYLDYESIGLEAEINGWYIDKDNNTAIKITY